MKSLVIFFTFACYNFFALKTNAQNRPIALEGATLIDVTRYGNSTHDIINSVVIIQHGKIKQVGSASNFKIPAGVKTIDVKGKFIIPGLIDCFSVLNNQSQANAYLYMGVTTIVAGPGDDVRGPFFPNAAPSPRIKMLIAIPNDKWDDTLENKKELSQADVNRISRELDQMDSLKKAGVGSILVHHRFPEELMPKLMVLTTKYKISTIGEMQYASYASGLKWRVNSFVHTSRYIIETMPDSIRIPLIKFPNDSIIGEKYIKYFYGFSIKNEKRFIAFAKAVAKSNTALMPTLSLNYTALPGHKNLWKERVAAILDPKDISMPMDTGTGKNTSWISQRNALRENAIENGFIKYGVHYITGSGADAFGAMPGISELIEIQLLHQKGLSNRQAIAAATNNVSIFNHWKDRGLIKKGRYADFLVLSANPVKNLENLKKIYMLWLNGKLIDRAALLTKAKR